MKTIEIKKVTIKDFLISFILGFAILFSLEHFGQFSYLAESSPNNILKEKSNFENFISNNTPVAWIYYDSYFDKKITTTGNGFKVIDIGSSNGKFYTYSNKIYYITEAFKSDFFYGILFSFAIFIIFLFARNIKIKLT